MKLKNTGTRVQKRKFQLWLFVLLFGIMIVLAAGGFYARYRSERLKKTEVKATDFHISSNYLKTDTEEPYQISGWANGASIELYNYEIENTKQVAASDITYQITVPQGFEVKVTTDNGSIVTPVENIYTLKKDNNKTTLHTLTITPSADAVIGTDGKIAVSVETTAPFKKILSGEFILADSTEPSFEVKRVTDNGDYYLLTVYSNYLNRGAGTIQVTYPEKLVPDNTSEQMRDWTEYTETFEAKAFTTYRLILFNPTGQEYDKTMFDISSVE